jgi:hypothetical protein
MIFIFAFLCEGDYLYVVNYYFPVLMENFLRIVAVFSAVLFMVRHCAIDNTSTSKVEKSVVTENPMIKRKKEAPSYPYTVGWIDGGIFSIQFGCNSIQDCVEKIKEEHDHHSYVFEEIDSMNYAVHFWHDYYKRDATSRYKIIKQ